ncbi:protein TFG-like isoform X2 [Crassostrea angulata]|uniref:protein TFG-like isoform X2 n=1 Tax=Magallana angulata TaxID=2784310 RepID=UPI0022B0A11D|nr:protein TFG-like isoform X2 [Crassostrea angulata]
MDLSGKLIIKVQLGDDIRRIPIHNEDITYDELVLMMQRVFRGKLNNDDDILIKYKDEDQDLVTIFDDSDLSFAIQCSRILKITLFVNGSMSHSASGNSPQLTTVRRELRQIRDRVTQLLDQLEVGENVISSSVDSKRAPANKDEPMVVSESSRRTEQASSSQPRDTSHSKEFDPYSSQKSVEETSASKVMSSFGMSGFPGGPQQQAPQSQAGPQQRPFQSPATSQPERQPSPMTHGMTPGQPAQGMAPGQAGQGMPGMPQGQQQGMPQVPPQSAPQGVPQGHPGYPAQQGGGNYGYGQYGGQGMPQQSQGQPQPGQGQMPPVSSAPWNQQQQQPGMYQGGYAGQPQPGATPPSSAGPTPGNQSNPYARGGGGPAAFGGYPKPAQAYPGYK